MIKGLDVSSYQGRIDWNAVKSTGIGFAYAKCTEGTSFIDDQYDRNSHALRQWEVPFGAYHYFHPSIDPIEQAQFFLKATDDHGGLIPMVDVEETEGESAESIVTSLATFTRAVEQKFGKKMLIYTGYSFWNTSVGGSDGFAGHPLWISEYNSDDAPTLPNGWTEYAIWQYADDGICNGISSHVDLDRLNPSMELSAIMR